MEQGSKIVFLTSSPDDSYQIQGEWVTGPFTKKNHFLEHVSRVWPDHAHVLVITASPDADKQNAEMMGYLETVFEESGLMVEELALLDRHTMKYAKDWVEESGVIILGGGHVPTQNAFFREIRLERLMEAFSGVIIGISAGTMNCAQLVYAQPELPGETNDPRYERFIPGLGLTKINVLPHYDKVKHERLDGQWVIDEISMSDSGGREFLALPDGSYVLCENGRETVYGRAYRIADYLLNQICRDGEAVVLKPARETAGTICQEQPERRSHREQSAGTSRQEQPERKSHWEQPAGTGHQGQKTGRNPQKQPAGTICHDLKELKPCIKNLYREGAYREVCSIVTKAAENIWANCGIRCIWLEKGCVRAELAIGPEHKNPLGLIYGGLLYNLADLVCGVAYLTMGGYGPTVSGDMQFIRGVGEDVGRIICECRVVKYGRRISFAQSDISDPEGNLLARGNFTFCSTPRP